VVHDILTNLQVSQDDFNLVKDMAVQSEETKAEKPDEDKKEKKKTSSEGWDDAKKNRGNGFLYSPEAYAVEQELKSAYEDSIHEIMNCPLAHDSQETLGHIYDVVFVANCQGQDAKANNSEVADVPCVKRVSTQRIQQKVSSTYGIAVLYVDFTSDFC
jgi:hypothetical protein